MVTIDLMYALGPVSMIIAFMIGYGMLMTIPSKKLVDNLEIWICLLCALFFAFETGRYAGETYPHPHATQRSK